MNVKLLFLVFLRLIQLSYQQEAGQLQYPDVRRNESVIETKFGVQVPDPYRWLEDVKHNETKQFVTAQNQVTDAYLQGAKTKNKLKARLTSMWNYPKYQYPNRAGNAYFYQYNSGLSSQNALYKLESLTGTPEVVVDPNTLAPDGSISMNLVTFFEDIMLYSLSDSSKGMMSTLHFKNLTSGENLPDVIENLMYTLTAWDCDKKGLFYLDFEDSESDFPVKSLIKYHRFGTNQSEDVVVIRKPEELDIMLEPVERECDKRLLIKGTAGVGQNLLYLVNFPATNGPASLVPVVNTTDAEFVYIGKIGNKVIFQTNKDAPNYKLIEIDLNNYAKENWRTLVAEHDHAVIQSAAIAADKIVINYSHHVKSVLRVFSVTDGVFVQDLTIPVGTVSMLSGNAEHAEVLYYFSSFLTPGTIYRVDLSTAPNSNPVVLFSTAVAGLNPDDFKITQVFYESKDNTTIPMYIIHKKTTALDGTNPCLLHANGGFNYNLLPEYHTVRLIFMKHLNGVMAIANIRGGGEYGTRWHEAGIQLNKQKSFDDFQAAAQYLIDKRYTNSRMLAIHGEGNGGLVVAVSITQKHQLFGAAIVGFGLLDMLRFQNFTLGFMWKPEYGDPDKEVHYKNLLKYSPLQNIKVPDGQFPATLVATAELENMVAPALSYKFVATLQYTFRNHTAQTNPLLLKAYGASGYGSDLTTSRKMQEALDILFFLQRALNLSFVEN